MLNNYSQGNGIRVYPWDGRTFCGVVVWLGTPSPCALLFFISFFLLIKSLKKRNFESDEEIDSIKLLSKQTLKERFLCFKKIRVSKNSKNEIRRQR